MGAGILEVALETLCCPAPCDHGDSALQILGCPGIFVWWGLSKHQEVDSDKIVKPTSQRGRVIRRHTTCYQGPSLSRAVTSQRLNMQKGA